MALKRTGSAGASAGFFLVLLTGCPKPEATSTDSGVAAVIASSTMSADAALPVVASAAAPASSAPAKYTFAKQTDWLGRWTIDIPTTFTKKEEHPCTDSGCSSRAFFTGDGIDIELVEPMAGDKTDLASVVAVRGGKKIDEKTLPRGYWVTMTTGKSAFVFVQSIKGFAETVQLSVTGPDARRAELEALIGHLSSSLSVATTKPATYCKPLPWTEPGASAKHGDFDGKLAVGIGLNASMKDEKPYVLQADTPYCDSAGNACWELQVSGSTKPDLKTLVGQHVHITGTFDIPQTAHQHRPIMVDVGTIGVQ